MSAVASGPQDALLRVDHLTKHYPIRKGVFSRVSGHVHAVDDVSFWIAEGETLGLVGESGCGKSTTGKAVLRLTDVTSGSIGWRGKRIDALPASEMRAHRRELQAVFQDPYSSLNPRMRAEDIVAEPIRNFEDRTPAEIRERVASLFERVGLRADQMVKYPYEFSGGQRQRLGIARALAPNPRLIVCDEPVSALDVSVQAQIVNLLKELQHKLGVSYLFIAHDLSVVRQIAARVVVMYLGKLVEIGPTAALYRSPRHPYTKALLAAVPRAMPGYVRRAPPLVGDIPSPIDPPSGCRFRTRCPIATPLCAEREPPLRELADRQLVACHHAA